MSKEQRNFLGIKINGDIYALDRKDQKPQSAFEPLVKALLSDPLIREFGWRQYTPYFNDGDTCEFSAYGLWVLTTEDKVDPDEDEVSDENFGVDYGDHPTLGGRNYEKPRKYSGAHEATYMKARALDEALGSGEFDNVLLSLFGDHASVRVTRESIEVDTYEHD